MKNDTQPILLKPEDAAAMISVSRAKMYRMIAMGQIEKVTLPGGRLIRIPIDAILKLRGANVDA